MNRNKGHPVSMNDFEVSVMADLTFPLIITYQLFWFSDNITQFLAKERFYQASNGIIIGSLDDFTYERTEMEGAERVYLLGFGSNKSSNCYKEMKILCMSEEEKLTLHMQISSAIHELVDKAQNCKDGSSYMVWDIK